ncbi:MAG: glycosyltransferase [Pedobacter sp.]|nr:MAG: glycosyltransferase [Pedobacter sp.]
MNKSKIHVSYLTQVPGPYRERMHEIVHDSADFTYDVIYCAKLEPNRKWKLSYGNYSMQFLAEVAKTFRHNNTNVWKALNKNKPSVLIITAFKPTMLYGVLWCLLNGKKLIVYNDGTYDSEQRLSFTQKLIRKVVYKLTSSFMAPGNGTIALYKSYKVPDEKIFRSCLCIDNSKLKYQPLEEREYHIMYSGQITERKLPFFFGDVAIELNKLFPKLKVLVVGDGPLRPELLNKLKDNQVDFHFSGFLDQSTLFEYYAKSKIFLFTTMDDVWGIVANEACASGTPVITSKEAGVAGELIVHNRNGYVLPLEINVWVNHILQLLQDDQLLADFSEQAIKLVEPYNHQQAADGLIDAVNYAIGEKNKLPQTNPITA